MAADPLFDDEGPEEDHTFHCHGEGRQLFKWITGREAAPKETMFEGIAGGGKTRIWAEWGRSMGEVFPGMKGLVIRKTRVSLNDAFLDIWEDEVWQPGDAILRGPTKEGRKYYLFPPAAGRPMRAWCPACKALDDKEGVDYQPKRFYVSPDIEEQMQYRCQRCEGYMDAKAIGPIRVGLRSRISLGGMDRPRRLYSTQWNWVYWNEMQEGELDEWERLHRSLRRPGTPFWILGGDCNPEDDMHWANLRAGATEAYAGVEELEDETPKLFRMVSRFSDNPSIDQSYIDSLFENLSGVRRDRLAKGLWVAAEGMVWPSFRRREHVLLADVVHLDEDAEGNPCGPVDLHVQGWEDPVRLQWFVAGLDFGFNAPGCLGVWGFDRDGRMFCVAEVYRTGWSLDQWAQWAAKLYRLFPYEALICDHEPRSIQTLNDRIGPECGLDLPALAESWDKRRATPDGEKAGIDIVRVRMKKQEDGLPRIFWLHGNIKGGVDKDLLRRKQPLCTVQEIGGYVYPMKEDGKKDKEDPDPSCPDHGCDQTRAVALWVHLKDLSPEPEAPTFHPRSYGGMYGHELGGEEEVA